MNGCELKRVACTIFWVVIIDENLNWKNHIQSVCLRLTKTYGVLYKIRYKLTTDALKSIYYSLCYHIIIYCLSIWVCMWPSNIKEIIVAQKKLIRNITYRGKHDSTYFLFNESKLLKKKFCYVNTCLLTVHNDLNDKSDNRKFFKFIHHSQGTRGNNITLLCS